MEVVSPTKVEEITYDERGRLSERLRSWYYDEGNGLYLSHETASAFISAKAALLDKEVTFGEIKKRFSTLRTQMKLDAGVYDQKEAMLPIVSKGRA